MNYFKHLFLLLTILVCVVRLSFSQADQGLNFQAVARDGNGNLIENEKLDIEISIQRPAPFKGSSPLLYYKELHSQVSTDKYGVFSLIIGTGSPLAGVFNNLDWVGGNFQVFIAIKFPGASTFSGIGTIPLQMNYKAYHAKIADSVINSSLVGLDDVQIIPSTLNTGDILTWDGSKWIKSTPPTIERKLFLGPMNFDPNSSNSLFSKTVVGAYFTSGTNSIFAPINLPVGAQVTGIKAHFYDNSSQDLSIKVYRFYEVTNGLSTMASYTSSGSSSSYQFQPMSITYGSFTIPDNYFTFVEVKPKSGNSWNSANLRMRGIEIDYTIPQ